MAPPRSGPAERGADGSRRPAVARIRYLRPGREAAVYEQPIAYREPDAIVTVLDSAGRREPLRLDGSIALGASAPIVWLTVRDEWYDVGRFHDDDGVFTGFYTNILTPPAFSGPCDWTTTDLFLDVWQPADGEARLLDAEELVAAEEGGVVEAALAARARREARRVISAARAGRWPPPLLRAWPLARALESAGVSLPGPGGGTR